MEPRYHLTGPPAALLAPIENIEGPVLRPFEAPLEGGGRLAEIELLHLDALSDC